MSTKDGTPLSFASLEQRLDGQAATIGRMQEQIARLELVQDAMTMTVGQALDEATGGAPAPGQVPTSSRPDSTIHTPEGIRTVYTLPSGAGRLSVTVRKDQALDVTWRRADKSRVGPITLGADREPPIPIDDDLAMEPGTIRAFSEATKQTDLRVSEVMARNRKRLPGR